MHHQQTAAEVFYRYIIIWPFWWRS